MRIHLIDGEKGGVGKSWLAFVMAEYLRSKLIQFYLYAADRSNPTAASRYKDKERYAEFYDDSVHYTLFSENIKKIDEPDVLLEMAMERTIVLDLPAQVYYPLTSWIEEKDIFELSKANQIDWVRWFVCNGEDESIQLLISSMEFYKHQQTVLVKNWGLCDNWDYFDSHEQLQATIKKHQITVIDFPKLADSKRIAINAKRWTFDEARELGQFGLVGKSEFGKLWRTAIAALKAEIEEVKTVQQERDLRSTTKERELDRKIATVQTAILAVDTNIKALEGIESRIKADYSSLARGLVAYKQELATGLNKLEERDSVKVWDYHKWRAEHWLLFVGTVFLGLLVCIDSWRVHSELALVKEKLDRVLTHVDYNATKLGRIEKHLGVKKPKSE